MYYKKHVATCFTGQRERESRNYTAKAYSDRQRQIWGTGVEESP